MATICLNMIVKNEAHVIKGTLENLLEKLPFDYWVISDTGSTDGTQELIRNFFAERGIPGELFEDQWEDFGSNRQKALEYAEGKTDYVLFFDADDRVEGTPALPELVEASYYLKMTDEGGASEYGRPLLVKNDGSFRWRAVLHEYLWDTQSRGYTLIQGDYVVISGRTGGRSLLPDKYKNDALVLEKALAEGRDPDLRHRYMFYCAQSWAAAGDSEKSTYWYEERAKEQGWDQELAVTLYRLGQHYGPIDEAKAIHCWLRSAEAFPQRAEAWYQLSRVNSWAGRHQVAYPFAKEASRVAKSKGDTIYLFGAADINRLWAHYELFMNAFYAGHLDESYQALKDVIYADERSDLYERELEKLGQLAPFVAEDSFAEVSKLREFLESRQKKTVLEALGLSKG